MNKTLRAIAIAVVVSLALAGCSSSGGSDRETFDFEGTTLNVVNDNANQPVKVSSSSRSGGEVTVKVDTQTLGQGPKTPGWSLTSDGTLDLGSACGGGWFGYCEVSWSIVVPKGTEVLVNGKPVAVD
jgi:hypothetical protein